MSESKFSESKFAESKIEGAESKLADTELIVRAKAYCFSHKFISVFEDYIKANANLFADAVHSEEHKLEYTACFQEYLELFAQTMEGQ